MKKINIKILALVVSFAAISYNTKAQNKALKVGTNPTIKQPSAVFEVEAGDKGVLLPRVALISTTDIATITSPANALTVFNTATVSDVTPGYYYYSTAVSKWIRLATAGNSWDITGNEATNDDNFLGTTDDVDLRLKVNKEQVGWFTKASAANGNSIFLGNAGVDATQARYSNFIGFNAGTNGVKAFNSNFIGLNAGNNAGAGQSNFIGENAGQDAADAGKSNFLGLNAGNGATQATQSNFIGENAGQNAKQVNNSNFIGTNAGYEANDALLSNFVGFRAGYTAINAFKSNFIGNEAGVNATQANLSNFIGNFAGYGAHFAEGSNFIGEGAGYEANGAISSNFIGRNAGALAKNAGLSNFIGLGAGADATSAKYSTFIGVSAGMQSTNAEQSVFIGTEAGASAPDAKNSNFIGLNAGTKAVNAANSNFFGKSAGQDAQNAFESIFIGNSAGSGATKAAHSIFIGANAGRDDIVDNMPDPTNSSILIGDNTSTAGFFNSIAIGKEATNTSTNQLMIGGLAAYNKIDMVIPNYPTTRNDVATQTPENFLYTDAKGKFLSAPITFITNTAIRTVLFTSTFVEKTASAEDETILVDATAGLTTITLPSASTAKGKKYAVKKVDASGNGVQVVSLAGTIDGNAAATGVTGTLSWQGWVFQSDGNNWYIISRI